jgi:hypothetical protein
MLLRSPNGAAVSIGPDHQVSSRLNRPAVAMAASAPTPSLVASQRVRVTLWVQASWKVPASNSRVSSGAAQNVPMMAGTRSKNPLPAK